MGMLEILQKNQLQWAIGQHIDKAEYPRPQRDPDKVLVNANIDDLFSNTWDSYRLDVTDPRGGPNGIGNRVSTAKSHWTNGGYMDPSEIYLVDGEVVWQNGRHRLVAARQMGHDYAPILVPKSDLDALAKIVQLRA